MMKFPFVIYGDFEALLQKDIKKLSHKTTSIQKHIPCGYALIVIQNNSNVYYKNYYRGEDCVCKFLEELKQISLEIKSILECQKKMLPLTESEWNSHIKANKCYLCGEVFSEIPDRDGFIDIKIFENHFSGSVHAQSKAAMSLRLHSAAWK